MRKWKLRWFSVVLAAVLMVSVVPNTSSVSAAGNGELTRYNFYWKESFSGGTTYIMYYGSDYACELGNGWFFGFNLGTLLSDKYLEGQGLVDYIRQAIETKTIPDELLQPRGSYGSAVVGMYDLNEVPPVFWYRGDLVDISRDRGEGIHSYTLPAGDEIIYVDYINNEIRPQELQLFGGVDGLFANNVRYSRAEDVGSYNGIPIYNYSYGEYVETFGEDPPLPPGWKFETERVDKRELEALIKDIGVNYYPYFRSFTENSWKPLETAFYAGIDVNSNAKATKEDVDEAVYNIKYYRTLLQLKPGEKSLDQQRREKAVKDFWDMMTKAIDNFRKVKDAAEYVPDDRVGDWVDKANTVTDKFDKAETVVKGGYDAYEWFDALNRASKTQTNGQVNEGIYDIIRKTNEIIMTPFGKGAQDFTGEGGVTVAKGISGKAHTSKVATETYTDAGQFDEAIQSMVPPALRQNGGR